MCVSYLVRSTLPLPPADSNASRSKVISATEPEWRNSPYDKNKFIFNVCVVWERWQRTCVDNAVALRWAHMANTIYGTWFLYIQIYWIDWFKINKKFWEEKIWEKNTFVFWSTGTLDNGTPNTRWRDITSPVCNPNSFAIISLLFFIRTNKNIKEAVE